MEAVKTIDILEISHHMGIWGISQGTWELLRFVGIWEITLANLPKRGIWELPKFPLGICWGVYFKNFGSFTPHGNLGNFPSELRNIPDVWEFGKFSWEISQEKEFGNLPPGN